MSELAIALNPLAPYAERPDARETWFDQAGRVAAWQLAQPWRGRWQRWRQIVPRVRAAQRTLAELNEAGLRAEARGVGLALRREGFALAPAARVFALVCEAIRRELGLDVYDVQLIGAWALLNGTLAELATGEGKTLAATLPACAAALAGMPVHVVTVNDYLVARDAEQMGPVYRALGLTVGRILQGMSPAERRAAYGCDIAYCTNKELVFDYLKDRIALGQRAGLARLQLERIYREDARAGRLLLRGLHFAIVDEADSVLIDEARTPLIISAEREAPYAPQTCREALALAGDLVEGEDYHLRARNRTAELTAAGKRTLAERARALGGAWAATRSREELAVTALSALRLYARDRHYLVSEGKIRIIDEYTGRVMPDRAWEGWLHPLIEAKEGCEPSRRRETVARITYQRFFRRYLRLAGMTGTAREVATELWRVYRLAVVPVPENRPCRRSVGRERVLARAPDKWEAIVERIGALHRTGRPVLVGTRSVAASELLSERLRQAALPHVVLNARQDAGEAEVVARAGEPGRITVATNMAGRGTDIRLAALSRERGGLHVILTERHEARRIDRQLFGRAARQGDPGSCEAIVSLDDELVATYANRWAARALALAVRGGLFAEPAARLLVNLAQGAAERHHARIRRETLRQDERWDRLLAFSGKVE
jgi:preprotein translocase subunit SecA